MPAYKNEFPKTPFSEEPVCVISKRDPCAIWAGTKILYSGIHSSGSHALQATGYNYWSGESDIEPISCSGWGHIRIPELNQLHKIFVFPKNPAIIARPDYLTHCVGTSGQAASGMGGCSGKVALLHWHDICLGSSASCSGTWDCSGGLEYNSGLVDIMAFGSEF
jgi:hypothetical protein